MTPLDLLRSASQQSLRWRDLLWESVLEELEERNPTVGATVRAAATARPARPLYGASTEDASRAWPYLDTAARLDWIWACEFVNRMWIQTMRAALTSAASNGAA